MPVNGRNTGYSYKKYYSSKSGNNECEADTGGSKRARGGQVVNINQKQNSTNQKDNSVDNEEYEERNLEHSLICHCEKATADEAIFLLMSLFKLQEDCFVVRSSPLAMTLF